MCPLQVPADGATLGEVVLRGNMVMSGYLKNERATREAFEGGWFRTGDLAVSHPVSTAAHCSEFCTIYCICR